MIQDSHTRERRLADLLASQKFVDRIRMRSRRQRAGKFGVSFAGNPPAWLSADLPEQLGIVFVRDEIAASEIKIVMAVLIHEIPQFEDPSNSPSASPEVTHFIFEWHSKREVEADHKTLTSIQLLREPSCEFRSRP